MVEDMRPLLWPIFVVKVRDEVDVSAGVGD